MKNRVSFFSNERFQDQLILTTDSRVDHSNITTPLASQESLTLPPTHNINKKGRNYTRGGSTKTLKTKPKESKRKKQEKLNEERKNGPKEKEAAQPPFGSIGELIDRV